VALYCTETGTDTVVTGRVQTGSEKRVFQQEVIEMCYGQSDFWKDFTGSDKAYPARGNPMSSGKIGWSIWRAVPWDSPNYEKNSQCMDIWEWAAQRQASTAPVSGTSINASLLSCRALPSKIYADGRQVCEIECLTIQVLLQ